MGSHPAFAVDDLDVDNLDVASSSLCPSVFASVNEA